jgi:hypothetical protein
MSKAVTAQQRAKQMKTYNKYREKPFQVGQLVHLKIRNNQGFFLVVGFEWDLSYSDWWVWTIAQRTGRKSCVLSHHLGAAGNTKYTPGKQ